MSPVRTLGITYLDSVVNDTRFPPITFAHEMVVANGDVQASCTWLPSSALVAGVTVTLVWRLQAVHDKKKPIKHKKLLFNSVLDSN